LLIACGVGCESSRSYTVAVANRTDAAVTVVLTKDGGPFEPAWASPEDVAIAGGKEVDAGVIPAGKTGAVERTGKFAGDSRAVLRVYRGQISLDQMLATQRGPLRVDVPVPPGESRWMVVEEAELDVRPLPAKK
jgi:hypothetical protein